MKKKATRLISAILSAAMALTSIPFSAFAEGEVHTHDSESNVITTPLDLREKTADESGYGWSWDYDTKTLTLDGVNIQATPEDDMMSVVTVPDGTEIVLKGKNTIVQTDTGESYTYVLSSVNKEEVNCDGTMTFSGDGVLNAENRSTDSKARSLGGTIIINGGTVNATAKVVAKSLEIHNDGVLSANASAVSNDGAAVEVGRGITVDGNGSLTAVGCAVENEYANNGAILLTSNFGDKISVSGNGSITVPASNKARVGIYYCTNTSIDAEISGGKVTAYGTKCGIYKVYLTMSGTGSVYATGGTYGIGQTVPTIDEDEFVVKGSTEFKTEESAVTDEVEFNSGYYEIGGADAKTVVIKPNTEPSIKLGKQIGAIYTDDDGNNSSAYFYITEKNFAEGTFNPEVEWVTSTGNANIDARITKADGNYVCEVICDTPHLTRQYELRVKCGEVYSNTVTVAVGKPHFTRTSKDSQSKYYTNYNGEQKITLQYEIDAGYENTDGLQYNWSSDSKKYDIADLGTVTTVDGVETLVFSDSVPEGSYVIYCDVVYNNDNGEAYTLTERFAFTFEECKHTGSFTDEVCDICHNACDHKNIDETGKCAGCGHEFVVTLSTDGNTPIGFDSLKTCLDSVTADTENYIKLYQDITEDSAVEFTVNHKVTLDLNGHKVNNKININEENSEDNNGELTLTGTGYVQKVYAHSYTKFTIDSNANIESDTIFIYAGAQFTVSDSANVTVRYLAVKESLSSEGATATSVKLPTGMKITEMLAYDLAATSPLTADIMLKNLLADNQMLKYDNSDKIIDLYYEATRIIINSKLYDYGTMTIVEHTDADHKYSSDTGKCTECGKPCEHDGEISTDDGKCSICGAVVSVALYTDTNGNLQYVDTDELHSILDEYEGSGTIKLFKDYSKSSGNYTIYGNLTIDLNGHKFTVRGVTPYGGKVTFKNSGNERVTCVGPVGPTSDNPGGTLIVDGDIYFDSAISATDNSTIILYAGKYVDLKISGNRTLYDILGEGKAFYDADGNLFNARVQAGSDLTVGDHPEHTYNSNGECGCGYVCPHDEVDAETGKCTECEYQYAAVIVKDGAIASVYKAADMALAFETAGKDENKGCTLKLFNYTGTNSVELRGEFTLSVEQFVYSLIDYSTFNIQGDITVIGGGLYHERRFIAKFNIAEGGKLTFDEKFGGSGNVTVGAGTFDCYNCNSLKINIENVSSNVTLYGGTFNSISYEGGGDRQNAEILTLLADNRAFFDSSELLLDVSGKTMLDGISNVKVSEHSHVYNSETGKCDCGRVCAHDDIDTETGICKTCQHSFVATLTADGKTTGFDTLSDCLNNTSEDSENYVKLYQDIDTDSDDNSVELFLKGNRIATIDLNGHRLDVEGALNVGDLSTLTLTGKEGSYIDKLIVKGKAAIDENANIDFKMIHVMSGSRFVVNQGANITTNYMYVYDNSNSTGEHLTSVKLATGMKINTMLSYQFANATGDVSTTWKDLLADDQAFEDKDGKLIDIYEKFLIKQLFGNVTVVEHSSHTFNSETGKCNCGYTCEHNDIDIETGICSVCKHQFTASISGVSGKATEYFDNIDKAFNTAVSEENNGCTLTLYKDCEITNSPAIAKTLNLNVNGKTITTSDKEIIVRFGKLTLTGGGKIDGNVTVPSGTLINGVNDTNDSKAVSITNLYANYIGEEPHIELYGGVYDSFTFNTYDPDVTIYGGSFGKIKSELETSITVDSLLAENRAFVRTLPAELIDGSAVTLYEGLTNVSVAEHEHRYNVVTGKCPCGVCALAVFTETTQSSETYTFIESTTQFKNIAENEADGVLKLTDDVDCDVQYFIINGNKTIDMNGHTLTVSDGTEANNQVVVDGNVTFENSASTRAVLNTDRLFSNGMTTINGDIKFNVFSTNKDGDAVINAGVFTGIEVQAGRSVSEILGSGKALAMESTGDILNANKQEIYRAGDNIVVTAHPTHTYDEHGNCACGYKCLHDGEGQVDEDSANKVCSECGATIYAKVTTADGKVKYFDDITEGLLYADKAENEGCVYANMSAGFVDENGITLSNGKFTITSAGSAIINSEYGYAVITIDGADVTIDNCAFNCDVEINSGSLTLAENCKVTFKKPLAVNGGTVNLNGGEQLILNGGLTVSAGATDVKVTINGGYIRTKIDLGTLTFADVLGKGVCLIKYEDTQEVTAVKVEYDTIANLSTYSIDNTCLFTKCDHKNDDGSIAFKDSSNICKYCNSEFAASVSYTAADGSEETELFGDIFDAFDKANEVGTATVTLQKNIEGTLSRVIESTGSDITLDLNGKKLRANYDGWYTVDVKSGKLTIIGEGDSQLYYVTVYDGAVAEIQSGVFSSLKVKDGGNSELKGGRFGGVSVSGEGRTLEDLLAYGYGYMNFMDGTWVTVANREKQTIANVTINEAPIKSASISVEDGSPMTLYRNGRLTSKILVTKTLADNTKSVSYINYANGNKVNSPILSIDSYYLSGSAMGMALADDGEVEYYTIFKCDGYEYKTNVLKFTLATCLHENFTNKDGFVTCDTCGYYLIAQVKTTDGEVTNYDDITKAADAAAENEGSTLTLVSRSIVYESITINGGRFTIDLAGVSAPYTFNITGGDITFKSSEEFNSDYSDRCNITVNGSDAKVTMDGKIKLGTVTTASTLTINSTEAYIKNLSISDGKVDIDGAQIDSLTTYGGEAVIKNVTVDSLTMRADPTDESEYDISIVSGYFGTVACDEDSGYTIGKAMASGSRVRYKGETAYDYERVMDLTEGSNLVFEVCDHKNDGGYPELNDANVCYYCNSQIVAIVSYTIDDVSDKRDPFSDICDAFDKANEVGTATVTLCSDIADSEIAHEINVTGNVALELNTKTLGATAKANNICISGGTLTVNGNGKVWGRIEAQSDSKLTIINGEYNWVIALSGSDVVILDGIIDDLEVWGTSKVEVSGGKFNYLDMYNGKAIESVLADGYAYKNADGTWLSIDERESNRYSGSSKGTLSVEEAPIKSATISAKDESPIVYRNGYNSAEFTADVTYSEGKTLYVTGCLIDGTVIQSKSAFYGNLRLSGYDVRDTVAEDGEIQYYCIFTCDGYDYKSNVVTLTVDTCLHPNESVKYDDDGYYVCDICDKTLTASVELSDGTLSYYGEWKDAIGVAEENDGCTLKLLSYINVNTDEIFDINKGRFTVDFNKIDGYNNLFAFNVKDGDITFTASQAGSVLVNGIHVSGENANVLVDSKAELNYLAVHSGKATVDGALINEITINGGESVIKVTDSLENTNLGTTLVLKSSETEYSVSIEGGYFSSVTCEDGSNYTLDKALAKGTRVSDDNGKYYKYDEIIGTNKLNEFIVKKCDHLEGVDVNKVLLDSSGRCLYCNNEYVATVYYYSGGGGTIEFFDNILDAFDKANEIGTATVKLYKDITDSDLTNNEDSDLIRNIIITGDVTLELNGKILGDIVSSSRIYIYNGGALTVNGDGRIPANIYTNPGSEITVNSGYCDYISADGDVIILGGTINRLDIYGDAEISGGTFKFLTIDNGGDTLDSVLVDGYAYYNVDDENWLTVAEREEKAINGDNVTVKEAPIKSARIAWRNGESPVVYRNGMQSVTADVAKELAGDLQVSYSDFVNGIELTADSVLGVDFTTISGADVDACGIPDGEVEYYCIFTCDGYEYKSNVIKFTLATCLHESFTNVDGIVTCDECGYCLLAQVETADGEVTYYDDITKAATAAAGNEGSTLTPVSRDQTGDTVTISGGKFTVDLAGVPAKYKFNITGGDITFKSSEEFGSSDRCNITVKGYSAKVTIDGKIELEAVELSGGTFTTNSTEAYINDLSIYGGKADIDGAYIRTITINGGDTVIKDVVANSLDMNRYGNISIVSGRFHIVTFNGYTLGKAIASGSRVIDHDMSGVILYKYADIQSKTEIDSIVVEKCDHKDKYGSYVLDGNPCPYCNEEIVATVSYTADGSEKTEPFSDVCDAFDKANEAGTATVTLYKDNSDGLTRAIHVTGNVTLELNGHDLSITYYTSTITVDDGGTLTVNGGENDELLIVEGLSGSKIIVNGGSLSTLIAEGDAELAGGSFGDIICAEGITVDSLLAPGYAYKNSDGTWVSIADRENTSISNVTVTEAPVLSAELTADKTKVYRNGAGKVIFSIITTMRDGNTVSDDNPLSGQGHTTRTVFGAEQLSSTASISGEASCSYLGMLVNDGEVVEVYYIVSYNGYELRTNAVTIEVDTCYHPADKVVSSANGNLVCGECESIICAEIINGDSTKCYADFEEAMADAQLEENEGCTVMVTGDISGISYITLYSGQFTLDLAGHKVEFIDDRIITTTGADVTIKDSFGGGIIRSGEGIARVITAQNDGKVTLEGGTIANNVYISSGKLDMCGATVENTVEIGANAKEVTIRDGSVIKGTLDVYANADPTHIKLSGGWYAYADVECSDFAKVLVKDKRLLKDSGGYYSYSELCDSTCKPENFTIVDCDHKGADGSIALDSSYACKYCGTKFVARVSYAADGTIVDEYFDNINEAFDKAKTINDNSIIKILNNVDGKLDKPITVTGKISLDFYKGKGISAVSDDGRSITVADGGSLEICSSGSVKNIVVENGAKLSINNGTFESVTVYGEVTLLGGTYGKLETNAEGGVASLLMYGYGYKNADGTWLTVAEREADSAENVTIADVPLNDATLSVDTNTLYRNSNNDPTVKFNIIIDSAANVFDGVTGVTIESRCVVNSNEAESKNWDLRYPNYNDTLNSSEILTLAGDSDVAEVYFIVTYDGYEVKTNTVSIDLVDCEHPSASIVDPITDEDTNGNITNPTYCEICKNQFHAKIVNGDSVKYYNDLYEAVADAQKSENEGCTLYPLYDANGYKEQIVISGGKFTFRVLARVYISKPVIIKGDADITILGRALVSNGADNTAVIVESGNVDFAGLATSDVIINGGNVTMSAINVRHLTINGGNVSIASGQFAQIDVTTEGKVIADYIVPGNWVQDGSTNEWIDIYKLASATAVSESRGMSVRMSPIWITQPDDTVYYTNGYYPDGIPSLITGATEMYTSEVNPAVAYQWFSVDENGNETEIEGATDSKLSLENLTTGKYYCRITYSNATTAGVSVKSDIATATITECKHTGGKADCTNRAVCEICKAEYGEPLGHNYVVINVVEPDYRNEGYSVFECTRCAHMYLGNFVPVKPIPNVTGIRVEKTTYDEAIVSWDAIDGVGGYYSECYVGGQWTPVDNEITADSVSAKITGLSSGLTYKIRIRAYAGSYIGKYEYVYVDTVPSPVWKVKTLKATDSSVKISWNRNTRVDGYRVEWYINNEWFVKDISGNANVTTTIDGLEAGSQYKVRVSAYRGELFSPYTYGYINTLPSEVTGISHTAMTSAITLTWDKNDSADGYIVEYYANSKWNVKTLTGKDETTLTVSGLLGYRTYKFRVKAYKGELISAYSDIYFDTAPTKASGLKVKSAVDAKAVVTWNTDSKADGYTVEYYIGGKWVQQNITDNKTTTAELDGLTPYSTYKARVRAYKGELYGDYSYITVTTALSSVTGITAVSAKSNSLTVAWDKNDSADGYKAEIYTGGKWVEKTIKGSANATVTFGGLKADSSYKIRIVAYKGENTSAYTYAYASTTK